MQGGKVSAFDIPAGLFDLGVQIHSTGQGLVEQLNHVQADFRGPIVAIEEDGAVVGIVHIHILSLLFCAVGVAQMREQPLLDIRVEGCQDTAPAYEQRTDERHIEPLFPLPDEEQQTYNYIANARTDDLLLSFGNQAAHRTHSATTAY